MEYAAKLLSKKIIRVNLLEMKYNSWMMYKDRNKRQNQTTFPLYFVKFTHQLWFTNINVNVNHQIAGKWFINAPKYHKENQLLSLKTSCWLSWK